MRIAAAAGRQQAGEHLDGGGFARAVRAEEPVEFPASTRKSSPSTARTFPKTRVSPLVSITWFMGSMISMCAKLGGAACEVSYKTGVQSPIACRIPIQPDDPRDNAPLALQMFRCGEIAFPIAGSDGLRWAHGAGAYPC